MLNSLWKQSTGIVTRRKYLFLLRIGHTLLRCILRQQDYLQFSPLLPHLHIALLHPNKAYTFSCAQVQHALFIIIHIYWPKLKSKDYVLLSYKLGKYKHVDETFTGAYARCQLGWSTPAACNPHLCSASAASHMCEYGLILVSEKNLNISCLNTPLILSPCPQRLSLKPKNIMRLQSEPCFAEGFK